MEEAIAMVLVGAINAYSTLSTQQKDKINAQLAGAGVSREHVTAIWDSLAPKPLPPITA